MTTTLEERMDRRSVIERSDLGAALFAVIAAGRSVDDESDLFAQLAGELGLSARDIRSAERLMRLCSPAGPASSSRILGDTSSTSNK